MPGEEFDIAGASAEIGASLFAPEPTRDPEPTAPSPAPEPSPVPEPASAPIAGTPPAPIVPTTTVGTIEPAPSPSGDPTAPSPADPTASAPKSWKPEVAATWNALPVEVRAEIARRESDFHNGLSQYKEHAGIGKQLQQTLQPFMETMRYYNIDPMQQINSLMRAHHTLAMGTPAQKQAMIQQLDRDYQLGLNLGKPADTVPYVDPAVQGLQERLDELQSSQRADQIRQFNQKRQEITAQVQAFAADPKHPYFDECATEIETLLKTGCTLDNAYQQAVWLNPAVRAKEITRMQKESQDAKEAAERQAAKAAAAAASKNRKVAEKGTHATVKPGTIDETLANTLAAIKARTD